VSPQVWRRTHKRAWPSLTLSALPHGFASDDEFLDYVQQTSFDYFWYAANPANGLVPDRTAVGSPCSIAAVGFGLSAIALALIMAGFPEPGGLAGPYDPEHFYSRPRVLGPQAPRAIRAGTIISWT